MTAEDPNIFKPDFLSRSRSDADGGAGEAAAEADLAGPWNVQPEGQTWHVIAEGEAVPEVIAAEYDTALLAAALLPGVGRPRLFEMVRDREPAGFPLVSAKGEVLAHGLHFLPDLAQVLHAAECLRRSPFELARFLAATRGSTLERAGRILWLWDQAPQPWRRRPE